MMNEQSTLRNIATDLGRTTGRVLSKVKPVVKAPGLGGSLGALAVGVDALTSKDKNAYLDDPAVPFTDKAKVTLRDVMKYGGGAVGGAVGGGVGAGVLSIPAGVAGGVAGYKAGDAAGKFLVGDTDSAIAKHAGLRNAALIKPTTPPQAAEQPVETQPVKPLDGGSTSQGVSNTNQNIAAPQTSLDQLRNDVNENRSLRDQAREIVNQRSNDFQTALTKTPSKSSSGWGALASLLPARVGLARAKSDYKRVSGITEQADNTAIKQAELAQTNTLDTMKLNQSNAATKAANDTRLAELEDKRVSEFDKQMGEVYNVQSTGKNGELINTPDITRGKALQNAMRQQMGDVKFNEFAALPANQRIATIAEAKARFELGEKVDANAQDEYSFGSKKVVSGGQIPVGFKERVRNYKDDGLRGVFSNAEVAEPVYQGGGRGQAIPLEELFTDSNGNVDAVAKRTYEKLTGKKAK